MKKITYYLGAGASYNACPILENQAEMMINLASYEISNNREDQSVRPSYNFTIEEKEGLPNNNIIQILWHIGYYGKQAKEYGTIDTYAKKLQLSGTKTELNLLKMSVSVFFDLWENFYDTRYTSFFLDKGKKIPYKSIDSRYISLLSVLLERKGIHLNLDESFNFLSWNYDLQLELAFHSFMKDNEVENFEELHKHYFRFMQNDDLRKNHVFHLNGHRGFFDDEQARSNGTKRYELKVFESYEKYWRDIDWVYQSILKNEADFNKYIKYGWEHDLNSNWFNKITKVIEETEILVIIGYSFPPFNRKIDQFLFSKLNPNKIKKIVYQDPNANEQIIRNLFETPELFKDKIEIEKEKENLNQFYIPNEYFITQKSKNHRKRARSTPR